MKATLTGKAIMLLALLGLAAFTWAAAPTVTIGDPTSGETIPTNQPTIQFTVVDAGSGVSDFNLSLSKGGVHPCTGDAGELSIAKIGLNPNDSNIASYVPTCNLSDGTYTAKVGTKSAAATPEFGGTSWNFTVLATSSSSAPANPRITAPAYTKTAKPKLLLKADGSPAKMRFSCNQNGPWDGKGPLDGNYNYATSSSDFNILDQNFGCSTSEGLKDIWVQYAFTTGAFSDANKASTFYDVTKPGKPGNLALSIRETDNAVNAKWDAALDNSNAPPKYNVYRAQDINFATKELVSSGQSNTYYFDKDKKLKDGTTYYYRVTAVDSAGNESEASDAKSIVAKTIISGDVETPAADDTGPPISDKDIKIVLVNAAGKETLSVTREKITIKGSFGKKLINVNLLFKLPGGKTLELIDASKPAESDNIDGFSKEYDMSEVSSGKGQILFKAKDPANERDLALAIEFSVDTDLPVLDWITPENEKQSFAGKVVLKVKAVDKGSGLDRAVFSFKELRTGNTGEIGTAARDDNGFFTQEWRFDAYYNGAYSVTATVYDKAGNSDAVLLKEVNITGGKNPDKELTEAKLKELEARKADIDKLEAALAAKNVVSTKLRNARDEVETKINDAKAFQAAKNYTEAQKKIGEALALITGLPNVVEVREAKKVEYSLDQNAFEKGIADAGLPEGLVKKAAELIRKTGAKRVLEVIEIKDGETSSFQVNIVLSLTNRGDAAAKYKVIEVVPKEFAASAKDLRSLAEYKVVNADPVLEFAAELGAGQSKEFVYSLNKPLTKDEAKIFVESEPLKRFPSPPVVLDAADEVKEVKPKIAFDLTPVLGVVALLVIAGLVFLAYQKFRQGETGGLASVGSTISGLLQQLTRNLQKGGKTKATRSPSGKRVDFLEEDEADSVITFKRTREAPSTGKKYEPLFINPEDGTPALPARQAPEKKLHPLERLIEERPAPKPAHREPGAGAREFLESLKKKDKAEPPAFDFEEPRPAPKKKGGGKWGYGSE